MAEHDELVAELSAVEKMNTGERLKHARKKRVQQLKKYAQYEKELIKKTSSGGGKNKQSTATATKTSSDGRRRGVRFVSNVILLEAAMRNDIDEVRQLLKNGTSPDSCNEDGLTALHQCCIDNSDEMVRLLIEHGANIDARDSELWTPLHAAATCGHVHLCRYLIEHNADLLAVNADCNMPYDICEDEVTLDFIESEMAKRGITQTLIDDLRLSREKTMLNDLEKVAAANGDLEFRGRQGETPLHIAAANGYVKVTEYLLGHDATVDCIDNDTWQPIHCAACWGQLEVLELLLEHGASLDSKTKNGETPVDICEDVELKQRIEEIRQSVESSRVVKTRDIPHRRSINVRSSACSASGTSTSVYSSNLSMHEKTQVSASVRRTSMREKKAISWKEAREEAQKLRESTTISNGNDDDDDDGKALGTNGIDSQIKSHTNLLTVDSVNDDDDITVTLTTDGAKFQQSLQPVAVSKAEIVPKSILSKSKKNGHAPTKPEQPKSADLSLSERKSSSYAPQSTENLVDKNDNTGKVPGPVEAATTLAELKRQRAQTRTGSTPTTPVVSTTVNGDNANTVSVDQKQRFSSTTDVVGSEENSKNCCIIL